MTEQPKVAFYERLPFIVFIGLAWWLLWGLPGLTAPLFSVDDDSLIQVSRVQDAFSWRLVKSWFTLGDHVDFYPLRDISYWLDVHLFGADTTGESGLVFRIQNFFWFGALICLFHKFLNYFRVSGWVLAAAMLFWTWNPTHSEILFWISSRKDLLSLFFGGLTVYAFLTQKPALCLTAFVLSLLSKASWVLLPAVVPAYYLLLTEGSVRARLRASRPQLWGIGLAISAFFVSLQTYQYSVVNDMRFHYETTYRLYASVVALGKMLAGLFTNRAFSIDVENWGDWAQLNSLYFPVGVLAWLGLVSVTIVALTRRGVLASWILLLWALYIPVSGLVFPHREFYSVRYLEPAFGLFCIGLAVVATKWNIQRTVKFGVAMLLLILGLRAAQEAQNWGDEVQPLAKAYALNPDNPSIGVFYLSALQNLSRWNKLEGEDRTRYAEVLSKLNQLCDATLETYNFRNGHLCYKFWKYGAELSPDKKRRMENALEFVK